MSWFAPRAKVTGYRLFLTVEGSNPKQLRLPARLTEYTLLNLTPDTEYSATLHAEQENTLSKGETAKFSTSKRNVSCSRGPVLLLEVALNDVCGLLFDSNIRVSDRLTNGQRSSVHHRCDRHLHHHLLDSSYSYWIQGALP